MVPKLGRHLCVQLEWIWHVLAAVCEHCKDCIVCVYHVYKDQWDSLLEANLQPIVNAPISTTVCAVFCSESLTVTMIDSFRNHFPGPPMALFDCISLWLSTKTSENSVAFQNYHNLKALSHGHLDAHRMRIRSGSVAFTWMRIDLMRIRCASDAHPIESTSWGGLDAHSNRIVLLFMIHAKLRLPRDRWLGWLYSFAWLMARVYRSFLFCFCSNVGEKEACLLMAK